MVITASVLPSARLSEGSSEARQSITVSTRLRRAARPATWPAAPGMGVSESISTTESPSAAGRPTRSPPSRTMSRSSATAAPPLGEAFAGKRGEQALAVVAMDAVVLPFRGGADSDEAGALGRPGRLGFGAGDDDRSHFAARG